MPEPDFTHGQLDVAISAIRDKNGLKIFVTDVVNHKKDVKENRNFIKNIGQSCRTSALKRCD